MRLFLSTTYSLKILLVCLLLPIALKAQAAPQELTHHNVEVNGLNFHYVEKGEGEVIFFLHGYPFFWYGWNHLIEEFSSTHRAIAPDNRGYNLSDKPKGVKNYQLDVLVSDVSKQIKALVPNNKVVLVGHDWGGTLAWSVAQKHPEQISKLVVINAPPFNTFLDLIQFNEVQRKTSSYMEILKSGAVEKKFEETGPVMLWNYGFNRLHDAGALTDEDKAAYFEAWSQPGSLESALNWYRANMPKPDEVQDHHYWPEKGHKVDVPSLLIWTDRETTFVPETKTETAKMVPDLTVVTINGSGHSPFLDQPQKVAKHIRSFISQ